MSGEGSWNGIVIRCLGHEWTWLKSIKTERKIEKTNDKEGMKEGEGNAKTNWNNKETANKQRYKKAIEIKAEKEEKQWRMQEDWIKTTTNVRKRGKIAKGKNDRK